MQKEGAFYYRTDPIWVSLDEQLDRLVQSFVAHSPKEEGGAMLLLGVARALARAGETPGVRSYDELREEAAEFTVSEPLDVTDVAAQWVLDAYYHGAFSDAVGLLACP